MGCSSRARHLTPRSKVEAVVYLVVVTLLTASALAYLICRLGFFYRGRDHRRVPRAALDEFFARSHADTHLIVPSYKEEARVVRNTLLSAALQEYPYLRVVLLIDDPPNPTQAAPTRSCSQRPEPSPSRSRAAVRAVRSTSPPPSSASSSPATAPAPRSRT